MEDKARKPSAIAGRAMEAIEEAIRDTVAHVDASIRTMRRFSAVARFSAKRS